MKFDPNLIVSESQFNKIMGYSSGLPLGFLTDHPISSFKQLMNLWVSRIDERMDKVTEGSPFFETLKNERGITYTEYTMIFEGVDEEDFALFHLYPAFEVLLIPDKKYLRWFQSEYGKNEQGYIKALRYIAEEREMAGLSSFLSQIRYEIPLDHFKKHTYICGATGSGKSHIIQLMFYFLQLLSSKKNDSSLLLLDPHGDLSEEIRKSHLNTEYKDRIIIIDHELQQGFSPIINPLEIEWKNDDDIVLHAQSIADAIENMLTAKVSDNMSTLLIPSLSLLIRKKGSTLLDLVRLMNNSAPDLVKEGLQLKNISHREIFVNFHKRHSKTKEAILKRITKATMYPSFENLVSGKSTINLADEINSGKVIIFRLSQRRLGSVGSSGLGRFILSLVKSIAFTRDQDKEKRMHTYFFIDECQKFISPSIESILEEARKFNLYLILANQFVESLGDAKDAVLANTGLKIIGTNGSKETLQTLAHSTNAEYEILAKLKKHHFFYKMTDQESGLIIKPHDLLIQDQRYTMTTEQNATMKKYQLEKYYKDFTTKKEPNSDMEDSQKKTKFDL